jgi:hypothetical protein
MSSEPPPDPLLPIYNPSSWDIPKLTPDEIAVLDENYIKFPIAQNAPISFVSDVIAPTQPNTDNSTRVATTNFVNNFFAYVRGIANIWTGLQTFSSGLSTTTITPVGTTLQIGDVGATVTLKTPIVPDYTYPVSTNTMIGYVYTGTFANVATGANTVVTLGSFTPVKGLYYFSGSTVLSSAVGLYMALGFGTTSVFNIINEVNNANTTVACAMTVGTPFYCDGLTTVNLQGQFQAAGHNFTNIKYTAVRIA